MNRATELLGEQPPQIIAHLCRIAAAKAEAIALDGRDVRIDGEEFRQGRLWTGLAKLRPSTDELVRRDAVDNDRKSRLAVGRHRRSTRLLYDALGRERQGWAEIEADFAVNHLIEAVAFCCRFQTEPAAQNIK